MYHRRIWHQSNLIAGSALSLCLIFSAGKVESVERSRGRPEHIPIMPNFIPAELAHWMDDRQAELQEALSIGDDQAVLELSWKMAQGAERMVQMKRHVPDDELALRSSPGEGRFAPY